MMQVNNPSVGKTISSGSGKASVVDRTFDETIAKHRATHTQYENPSPCPISSYAI